MALCLPTQRNQCPELLDPEKRPGILQRAVLDDANLQDAVLDDANLQHANLHRANLQHAVLIGANLQHAVLIATDLRQTVKFTPQQLEGKEPPLLRNVALPKEFTFNPNRDCDRIPKVLHDLYPGNFKTIEDAQAYVNQARQKKWD
jgi:uncharacterized protein YjbI with pentapeptide repeats